MNDINPVIERSRRSEELIKQRVEQRIKDLENYVNNCNYRSLRTAYLLGEESKSMGQTEKIAKLVAQFELDCGCYIKP